MSRGLVIALCALASSACLKEPKFNGTDPPKEAGIDAPMPGDEPTVTSAVAVDGHAAIEGRNFRLTFSATGGHFPDSLQIGNIEMLGQHMNCNAERKMGLALFPSLLISDIEQPNAPTQDTPTVPVGLAGPLVAQVRVPFDHSISCSGVTTAITGFTTFTAFPDGRIVRHDDLTVDNPTPMTSTNCTACTSGSPVTQDFYLTTFSALRADAGNAVTGFNVTSFVTNTEMIAPVTQTAFCTDYMQRQVTVAVYSDGSDPGGMRIRQVDDTPRTIAFVHDVLRSAGSIEPSASRQLSTTLLLGENTSCDTGATLGARWQTRPEIEIASAGTGFPGTRFPVGLNGIYSNASLGPIGFPEGALLVRSVSGEIPGGFAVWIELGQQQPASDVRVEHSDPTKMTANWYRSQVPMNDQILLYFRDALAAGDVITITPP